VKQFAQGIEMIMGGPTIKAASMSYQEARDKLGHLGKATTKLVAK
jgi:hypothetical protein